jgi:hypothetical protein
LGDQVRRDREWWDGRGGGVDRFDAGLHGGTPLGIKIVKIFDLNQLGPDLDTELRDGQS